MADESTMTTCAKCGKEKSLKSVAIKLAGDVTYTSMLCSTCTAQLKQVQSEG